MANWTKEHIDEYVRKLYRATLTHSAFSSEFFTNYQWEVLCSEYLRKELADNLRIDYLLTPIGRTMKDIDIDGANQKFYVLAPVSFTTNPEKVREKMTNLLTHGKALTFK